MIVEKYPNSPEVPKYPVSLREKIESSAVRRAKYTRHYFEITGKSLDDFVGKLRGEPFKIDINPRDDKSLSLGIFSLQQKLGFSPKLSKEGCDGMCGPYTYHAFARKMEGFAKKSTLGDLREQIEPVPAKPIPAEHAVPPAESVHAAPAEPVAAATAEPVRAAPAPVRHVPAVPAAPVEPGAAAPAEPKIETQGEKTEISPTRITDVAFMGASTIEGLGTVQALKGADTYGVRGQNTRLMRARFFPDIIGDKDRPKYKTVVIAGGVNDIAQNRPLDKIQEDLSAMCRMAKEAGMKVILCTLIPMGDYLQKLAQKKGIDPGKYQAKLAQLNDWIRSQQGGLADKVIDVYTLLENPSGRDNMNPEYLQKDKLHPNKKGYTVMADYIIDEANLQRNA